jgi:hypothetical protein
MDKILLSLDYSTSCTGWAKFNLETGKLVSFGEIYPDFKNKKIKGKFEFEYPEYQTLKLERLAEQIIESLIEDSIQIIVIEEINKGSGSGRIGQKVLDGGHFLLLSSLPRNFLKKTVYCDSDGKKGWRSASGLKLQLSEVDRLNNKNIRKLNNKLKKGKKLPLLDIKQLACNFVNKQFSLHLDISQNDICDAIGMGWHYLTNVLGEKNES